MKKNVLVLFFSLIILNLCVIVIYNSKIKSSLSENDKLIDELLIDE